MFGSCGQSMCLPHLPAHVSLSSPLEACFMEAFAASGVLASLKIKLARGGTEMYNSGGAYVFLVDRTEQFRYLRYK